MDHLTNMLNFKYSKYWHTNNLISSFSCRGVVLSFCFRCQRFKFFSSTRVSFDNKIKAYGDFFFLPTLLCIYIFGSGLCVPKAAIWLVRNSILYVALLDL